jgi:hypothetical protein
VTSINLPQKGARERIRSGRLDSGNLPAPEVNLAASPGGSPLGKEGLKQAPPARGAGSNPNLGCLDPGHIGRPILRRLDLFFGDLFDWKLEGFDIIKEHGLGVGAIFGNAILEALGFKRSKKTFHRRVIVAVGLAAHTGRDAVDVERLAEVFGGVLHPAIRMMESWSRPA